MSHINEKINCHANFAFFNVFMIFRDFPPRMFIFSIIQLRNFSLFSLTERTYSKPDAKNQFNSVTRNDLTPIHSRYQRSQQSDFENDNGFDIESDGDELVQNPLDRGPYFDVVVSKNVTALVGSTAYLNCRVRNLGNKTVRAEHSVTFIAP